MCIKAIRCQVYKENTKNWRDTNRMHRINFSFTFSKNELRNKHFTYIAFCAKFNVQLIHIYVKNTRLSTRLQKNVKNSIHNFLDEPRQKTHIIIADIFMYKKQRFYPNKAK